METLNEILRWLVDSQELVVRFCNDEEGFGSDFGTPQEEDAARGWASLFAYLYFDFLETRGELPDSVESPGSWWHPDYETTATTKIRRTIEFSDIIEVLAALHRKDPTTLEVFKKYRSQFRDHPWVKSLRFDLIGQPGIRKNSPEHAQLIKVRDVIVQICTEARKSQNRKPDFLKLLPDLFALEKTINEQTGEHVIQNPGMTDDVIEIIRQGTGRRDYDGSRFINQSNRPFHRPTDRNRHRR